MSQILKRLFRTKMPEALGGANLTKLALVAMFLTLLDTVQSYYGQKVINVFSEVNNIPALYYAHGLVGYAVYAPIEFGAIFLTVSALWLWASFLMWYFRNVVKLPTWSRNP